MTDDLRDARVDAAWRAASREEPPRGLDDAIRAAARREIGAKPRSTDASMLGVPQSLRPERWWWPLAAAATIGAVAIGLLQLVEPDHVIAPAADKAVVSDTPAALERKTQEAPAAPAAAAPVQEPQAKEDAPPPRSPPSSSAAPARATDAASSTPAKPAATLRKDVAQPSPREESARNVAPTRPAPVELGAASAPAVAPPPAAEPFPADKLERESKEVAKRDATSATGTVAESTPPAARGEPARQPQQTANSPSAQGVTASRQRAQEATVVSPQPHDARGYAAGLSSANADRSATPRAKVAPKLSVPDWIELIRKLRGEGRTDEAAKELTAFRNAYADHEQLLPPDLRDWKPAQ